MKRSARFQVIKFSLGNFVENSTDNTQKILDYQDSAILENLRSHFFLSKNQIGAIHHRSREKIKTDFHRSRFKKCDLRLSKIAESW